MPGGHELCQEASDVGLQVCGRSASRKAPLQVEQAGDSEVIWHCRRWLSFPSRRPLEVEGVAGPRLYKGFYGIAPVDEEAIHHRGRESS